MKKLLYLLLFLFSCSNKETPELEPVSFKQYISYKGDSLEKEAAIIYYRQRNLYLDSTWNTESIMDSIYRFKSNEISKVYFNLADTVEFRIVDSKGDRMEKVIVRNRNKSHFELQDKNNHLVFKRITYSGPNLRGEIPSASDTIENFNYFDYRVYNIDSVQFKIYCFASIGMCDDCDHCVYFSKDLGEIATYAIDWGHLLIVDSTANTKKLQVFKRITETLKQDTSFFPHPKSLKPMETTK